ncbi:CIC11C00000003822 [Sungouiella intermedia]|uniref:CIC11C00000003822 n=1 Tax=Sungouiella intermedia TaxID=45354 RepID=A0A1L0BQU3_9ASCO|nr:CIC11C00000003822 [[Candida] intermedia]
MAPKKHLVKLHLQPDFLRTLPVFTVPKAKRVKKVAGDEKKSTANSSVAASKGLSPAPEEPVSHRINTGPKEMSTAGLTVNSVSQTLDKSGAPCKKWVRTTRQFKTFSGFKVKLKAWKQKPEGKVKTERKISVSDIVESSVDTAVTV